MKTEKELNSLKEEYTELNKQLAELTEEELVQVSGGNDWPAGYAVYRNESANIAIVKKISTDEIRTFTYDEFMTSTYHGNTWMW